MAVRNASAKESFRRLYAAHKRDCMEYSGAVVNGITRAVRYDGCGDTQEAGDCVGAAVGFQ